MKIKLHCTTRILYKLYDETNHFVYVQLEEERADITISTLTTHLVPTTTANQQCHYEQHPEDHTNGEERRRHSFDFVSYHWERQNVIRVRRGLLHTNNTQNDHDQHF